MQIVLADDHSVFRECLARALHAAGHDVVAEASDGDSAVAAVQRHRPDVAVLDVSMPGCDGIAATRRIASFGVPVVVLTMHADAEVRERAADAGARSLLVKDCKTADLLAALEAAASPGTAPAPPKRVAPTLSAREQEVLGLLAAGAAPPDIASRLYISSVTVKNHLASIYRKLGCRGRTQAVIYALQHGLAADQVCE